MKSIVNQGCSYDKELLAALKMNYYTALSAEQTIRQACIAHTDGHGHSPHRVSMDLLRACENALLDFAMEIIPEETRIDLETMPGLRPELLNLILRLPT